VVNHKNVVQRKFLNARLESLESLVKPHSLRVSVKRTGEEALDAGLVMKNFHRTAQERT